MIASMVAGKNSRHGANSIWCGFTGLTVVAMVEPYKRKRALRSPRGAGARDLHFDDQREVRRVLDVAARERYPRVGAPELVQPVRRSQPQLALEIINPAGAGVRCWFDRCRARLRAASSGRVRAAPRDNGNNPVII